MSLTTAQIHQIEATIQTSLLSKLKRYRPESNHMPFHYRLLGQDRMALYSFIQSLNTTFGVSIFEPVAKVVAQTRYAQVETGYTVGAHLYSEAQAVIQHILDQLGSGQQLTSKPDEIQRIRDVCQSGLRKTIHVVKADIFLKQTDGSVHLFDIKTAKPNISSFKDHKRTLLEWCAIALAENPTLNIHSAIAIPYNPYAPQPYQRWTLRGMLDIEHELKVAEEFWDELGGVGTYPTLLDCFERVGMALRPQIDQHFTKFGHSDSP